MALPRTVLVTGSNRGIGLEFIRQLAKAKDGPRHIFATCRQPEKALALKSLAVENKSVKIFPLDVEDDTSINLCVNSVQTVLEGDSMGLNLLVNNAGKLDLNGSIFPDLTRKSLLSHFNNHTVSALLVAQAFHPLLFQAVKSAESSTVSIKKAVILNISSGWGSILRNTDGQAVSGYGYRIAKAGVNMATKCLSIDFSKDDTVCACICPGWVQTDMGGKHAALTPEKSVSSILSLTSKLTAKDRGKFFDRTGKEIPF